MWTWPFSSCDTPQLLDITSLAPCFVEILHQRYFSCLEPWLRRNGHHWTWTLVINESDKSSLWADRTEQHLLYAT